MQAQEHKVHLKKKKDGEATITFILCENRWNNDTFVSTCPPQSVSGTS